MPDGRDATPVRVLTALSDIDAAAWDACAGGTDPFVSHAFLKALEDSGSAVAETGWLGRHLVIEDDGGQAVAVAPLYLKNHSYGEYVFDWGWAEAFERAGGRYYPKLQCAVPFSPVTGRRLLVRPDLPAEQQRDLKLTLASAMVSLAEQVGASSIHLTFCPEDEWHLLTERAGWLARIGEQFHWTNAGYRTFDDFLAALASRKRKQIKKERKRVAESGVRLHRLTGDAIRPEHWDALFRFYRDTSDRKWGNPYLTRAFFDGLGETMRDRVLLILAEQSGRYVGGALNLIGADTLYGRYWGCVDHFEFLHFEACYYQAIDFAIERGLAKVEAGAQGPHKLQRGYLPVPTYSAHWVAHPGLRDAVLSFVKAERRQVEWEIGQLADHSPFRKDSPID